MLKMAKQNSTVGKDDVIHSFKLSHFHFNVAPPCGQSIKLKPHFGHE